MSSDGQKLGPGQSEDHISEQVVDPEDYNRTQRFKEIHQARQRVTEFVTNMEMPDSGNGYYPKESSRLAYLVALYILELEPLIVRSEVDAGELVPESMEYDSLREYAVKMGIKFGNDGTSPPSPQEVMQIYSIANRFYARIGMDLDLEGDNNEAGADYSDLLDGDDA